MDLYIQSPIRLHGVVLNSLSTGTALPFILSRDCTMGVVGLYLILQDVSANESVSVTRCKMAFPNQLGHWKEI
jgi:hypothetical protein